MAADDPRSWMWSEACALLDRAERLNRRFFEPDLGGTAGWSPPVDVYETGREVWIMAAVPGVPAEALTITIEGDTLVLSGQRPLPAMARGASIHRLEIPHGRFERRLRLVSSGLELRHRELVDGCLVIGLAKRF
jgi:HSP20 family protein